jgi:hypothetical protein
MSADSSMRCRPGHDGLVAKALDHGRRHAPVHGRQQPEQHARCTRCDQRHPDHAAVQPALAGVLTHHACVGDLVGAADLIDRIDRAFQFDCRNQAVERAEAKRATGRDRRRSLGLGRGRGPARRQRRLRRRSRCAHPRPRARSAEHAKLAARPLRTASSRALSGPKHRAITRSPRWLCDRRRELSRPRRLSVTQDLTLRRTPVKWIEAVSIAGEYYYASS